MQKPFFAMALTLALGACSMPAVPARSVAELLADPAVLQGVMARCAESRPSVQRGDAECINARIAVERQAREQEAALEEQRAAAFERQREAVRERDERARDAALSAQRTDAYSLPVVPPSVAAKPATQ